MARASTTRTKSPSHDAAASGAVAVGLDMGATLAKLAVDEGSDGAAAFELLPSNDPERVARRILELAPRCVGLTGCGASELARRLPMEIAQVNEFAAWGAGASSLLRLRGEEDSSRYLLVSLGTGTSVLLVDAMSVTRIGGTALGGGTVAGLAAALLGDGDFAGICELAGRGRRGAVDLMVSDIYRAGEIPLLADMTASAFGKLGRVDGEPSRPDLATAIMGLVGENVALICAGLAANAGVERIVFGGSTLRHNPVLAEILVRISSQLGRRPTLLADGEFAGALGGLELARARV